MMIRITATILSILLVHFASSQIVGTNGYLIGNYVEIGIDDAGFEGADTTLGVPPGIHFRSNSGNLFGFVADPLHTGWTQFDGDFFTPGSPENGWGLELGGNNGIAFHNNGSNFGTDDIAGTLRNYLDDSNCLSIDWQGGIVTGPYDLSIHLQYHLLKNETFYTTRVKIINNNSTPADSVYYYRNLDPDNNQSVSGEYDTQNTIVNEYSPSCPRTLASASSQVPWYSFFAMGGIDTNIRVAYGGFSNRDASDIWNGVGGIGGFVSQQDSTRFADEAIALAHLSESIPGNDSVEFEFLIILDSSAVDAAFASLYDIYLDSTDLCAQGNIIDTARLFCPGDTTVLQINGSDVGDFNWSWSPTTDLSDSTGVMVVANPGTSTLYTATGNTPGTCTNSIQKQVYVEVNASGPLASWTDPGYQCDSFDLSSLTIFDQNAVPNTLITYHDVMPDSVTDFSDTTGLGVIYPGDSVWVMIGDTNSSGCYDVQLIDIAFSSLTLDTVSIVAACDGFSNGSIEVEAIGGAPGVIYDIGFITQSIGLFEPLSVGTYTIYAYDGTGCIDSITATIDPGVPPVLDSLMLTDPLCSGDANGQLEVLASGGTGSFTYSIDGGVSFQASNVFNGLTAGSYSVIIVDSVGCEITVDSVLTDPPALSASASSTDEVFGNDGSIDLTPSGGTPGYTFDWDLDGTGDFDDPEDIAGLSTGFYNVVVMDANGCTQTLAVFVDVGTEIQDSEAGIIIYPNPMEGELFILNEKAPDGNYQLIDGLGRVVRSASTNAGKKLIRLDVKDLVPGIYFLQLYKEGTRVWESKLIKN